MCPIWCEVEVDGGTSLRFDHIPQASRAGIDQAAFQACLCDHKLAPLAERFSFKICEAHNYRLERLPGKTCPKMSLQFTSNPQLEGLSGATSTPRWRRISTHAPVEPVFGQLPPPSASTVASGLSAISPSGVAKRVARSSSQPSHS